jgi:hypothetical protein
VWHRHDSDSGTAVAAGIGGLVGNGISAATATTGAFRPEFEIEIVHSHNVIGLVTAALPLIRFI